MNKAKNTILQLCAQQVYRDLHVHSLINMTVYTLLLDIMRLGCVAELAVVVTKWKVKK